VTSKLEVSADGRHVAAQGPIGRWDVYARSATFAVVITQVQADGTIVVAEGRSNRTYEPPNRTWRARATVNGGGALRPGEAYAWGIASVRQASGAYELYTWPNEITLERAAVPAGVR
jgi:hypothetical protein